MRVPKKREPRHLSVSKKGGGSKKKINVPFDYLLSRPRDALEHECDGAFDGVLPQQQQQQQQGGDPEDPEEREAVKPFVRVPEADVHSMVADAVAIEKEFILESLPCSLLGMNAVLMGEYLEFVADRLLVQLGYGRRYGRVECPFDFMESMSIERKTNFFEARVSEYRKPVAGAEPARAEDYNDF